MIHERPTFDDLAGRIAASAMTNGGVIPKDVALVWDGYLAALIEWGLITVDEHFRLVDLLPSIPDSPVIGVFLGFDRSQ